MSASIDYEFFVHGVPGQHEIWNVKNKKIDYIDKFYDGNITDDVKYVVSAGPNGGFCYSFLVYKNVQSAVGRDGCYFGMTLWCQSYLYAVKELISIFNVLFEQAVSFGILKNDNGVKKYIHKDFNSIFTGLQKLDKSFGNLASNTFNPSLFKHISGISNIGRTTQICLTDVDNNEVFERIKKGEKVEIAYYFETKASLKSKDSSKQKLQEAKNAYKELEKKYKTIEAEVSTQNGTITDLQKANENLENQLKQANREKESIKNIQELKRVFEEKKDLFSRVSNSLDAISNKTVNGDISESGSDARGEGGSTGSKFFGGFEDIRQNILLLLLVISFAVNVSYLLGWIPNGTLPANQENNSENSEQAVEDSTQCKNDTIKTGSGTYVQKNSAGIIGTTDPPIQSTPLEQIARLDIDKISRTGYVKINKEITFSVQSKTRNALSTEDLTGKFTITKDNKKINPGMEAIVSSESPGVANITFYEEGNYKIVYTHNNDTLERDFQVIE